MCIRDRFTLKNYFISKGFLLVEVRESYEINDNAADLHFKIDEGKQFFVSKVHISGNKNISDDIIQNILSLYELAPFNSVLLNERVTELHGELEYFSKLFYLFCRLEIDFFRNKGFVYHQY